MKNKTYTIGELFRMKLLLNHKRKPYTSKATISRIVSRMKYVESKTPWGVAKRISEDEVKRWNEQW